MHLPIINNFVNTTVYQGEATGKLNAPLLALHYSYPLKDFLVYGFSFNNPFGQSANFPESSIVNATVTEATLITWNISNALGYKINKNWLTKMLLLKSFEQSFEMVDVAMNPTGAN